MLSMPTLYGSDSELKRKEVKAYFQYCYKRYESLFDIVEEQKRSGITKGNPFGIEAHISAYEEGGMWLEELKKYLWNNISYVMSFIQSNSLAIKIVPIEATFLLWLDCLDMDLSQEDLVHFFIYEAKIGLNDGLSFGKAGEGFMRLNIGTSKEALEDAMQRLSSAYKGKN